jgi:hypothetical protein
MRSQDPGSVYEGTWRVAVPSPVSELAYLAFNPPPTITSLANLHLSSPTIDELHGGGLSSADIAIATSQRYELCGAWQEAISSFDNYLNASALGANHLDDTMATLTLSILLRQARMSIRYNWDLAVASVSLSRGLRLNSSDVATSIEAGCLLAVINIIQGASLDVSSQWLLEHVHRTYQNRSAVLKDTMISALETSIRNIRIPCVHTCFAKVMQPVLESATYYLRSSLDKKLESLDHLILIHSTSIPFATQRYNVTASLSQLLCANCSSTMLLNDETLHLESNAHFSFASLLASVGSHNEAGLNLLAVPCPQIGRNECADVTDTILVREVLTALVPSVLSGPGLLNDEVIEILSSLQDLLRSLLKERWRSSLDQAGGIGPTALGTRWHFLVAYFGLKDQRSIMQLISKVLVHLAPSLNSMPSSPLPEKTQRLQPVIRVGFLSAHWRFHSVGRLLSGVAVALAGDPKQRFDVVVLHTAAPLPADTTDPVARKLASAESEAVENIVDGRQRLKQVFLDKTISSFSEIQATLLSQKLDVLIFGDVGMDVLGSYLALGRYASCQVAFWGHPVTSGSPNMDYFISSTLFEPPHADSSLWHRGAHSEQLVMLDGINIAFDQPKAAEKSRITQVRAELIAAAFPRIGDSSESNIRLYICSQNPTKLHPSYDDIILGILDRDSTAVVVLSHNAAQPLAHRRLVARLNSAVSESYTGNLTDRVVFVDQTSNYDEFLALQCAADVFLDPYPFGGGVTALEALACRASGNGLRRSFVPIVTAPKLQTVPALAAGFLRTAHGTSPLILSVPNVERLTHGSIVTSRKTYVDEALYLASSAMDDDDEGPNHSGEGIALLWNSSTAVDSWGQFIQTIAVHGK